MNVTLIDWMGDDDSVVNAARVSFDKIATEYPTEKNASLIDYLAKHGHWSPFAHVMLKFRVTAPIFVARQLAKHQVGLSWNEVSRRYVTVEPVLWKPDYLRKAAENVKQGSSDLVRTYRSLLADGVCPEQARAVLPQGVMTEWIWTGSLYAFNRVVQQRTHPTAQQETKEVALRLAAECATKFPTSWTALCRHSQ
jgi:thymidylate synthase (FAD)